MSKVNSMDTSIAEQIIKASKGKLDACEVCYVEAESKEAKFASNKLKTSQGKGSRAAAIRGFLGGKMGFYVTSDLGSAGDIVDAVADLANEGGIHEIELPVDFGSAAVETHDPAIAALTPADLVAMGRKLVENVRKHDPKFLNEAGVDTQVESVFLINSKGGHGQYQRTVVSAQIAPQLADESGFLEIYEYDFATRLPSDGFENLSARVIDKLKNCVHDAKAATGEYEILLMPKATGIMNPLSLGINARAVLKGYSPWKDKLGGKVSDERFELVDDPLKAGYIGSQPFDDEGTPSGTKPIIEGGILKVFVNDLFSAAKLGVAPTGNAFRQGTGAEPRASASTLFVKEGEKDYSELVAGMKKGIIVDQIMGAHTSSPFSGDFSVNIDMGWLVEDGAIVGRLKDCMLAGNIFEWLKDNLAEVGRGWQKPSPSLCIPPMLFRAGSIAAG